MSAVMSGAETIRMTTDVVSATLRPGLVRPPLRDRLKLEHVVMGGAVIALIVLVVLPLLSLLFGSVKGEQGLSFDHFSEVLSGRLYLTALKNSLILGAWTSLFSLVLGLVLAWAVSRTDVPGKPLIQLTATLSYLSPPFLTAIALTYLFSPNAGLINVLMRDTAGLPWLTFNIFSMPGLVLVTVMHTFPFVYLLASSALLSVDASYEEAAQILGASKLRTALSITAPLVAPAILSGTLLAFVNALPCSARRRSSGCPRASSRCRRASMPCSIIRRNTDWRPRCRWSSCSSPWSRSTSSARSWRGDPT